MGAKSADPARSDIEGVCPPECPVFGGNSLTLFFKRNYTPLDVVNSAGLLQLLAVAT